MKLNTVSKICAVWLVFLAAMRIASAEAPNLEYLFPTGGGQQTTNKISIGGKLDPWPAQIWIDCGGVRFEPQTNKGVYEVIIDAAAPAGPHLVRLFNGEGASAPRCFVIGTGAEVSEVETNDSWKQAQTIASLPVTINGRLDRGDVDSFAVTLEAGKTMVASVDAYALGSPIDPHLSLLNEQGIRVAFNSDRAQSFDPLLAWKVEKPGTYIVQIAGFAYPPAADIKFAGSAAAVYRLTIGQDSVTQSLFPASVRAGGKTEVHLSGLNFDSTNEVWTVDPPATNDVSTIAVPSTRGVLHLAVNDLPHESEHEPNNQTSEAQELHRPVTINGRIDPAGDEDRFRFEAKKNEKIEFRVRSASLGFPFDGFLRIEDSNGKQVARDDDAGEASDPLLNWKFANDGTYVLVLGDLYRRGGPEFAYALEVQTPRPDFKVIADVSALRLEPGKTNELKLAINRINGYTNDLTAEFFGLPPEIKIENTEVGPKDKELKVRLVAAEDAKPFNGAFRIVISDKPASNASHAAQFELRPKESRFGDLLIGFTDQFWLTVVTNTPSEKSKAK